MVDIKRLNLCETIWKQDKQNKQKNSVILNLRKKQTCQGRISGVIVNNVIVYFFYVISGVIGPASGSRYMA